MNAHLNAAAMAVRGAGTEAPAVPAFSDPLVIVLPGAPKGKGRPRFWNGRAVTPEATRAYEHSLAAVARVAMAARPVINGPMSVSVEARMPVPASWSRKRRAAALAGVLWPTGKPDADNILKCLDALNGIVWRDDALIVATQVLKIYSAEPSLIVTIRAIDAPDPGAPVVPV